VGGGEGIVYILIGGRGGDSVVPLAEAVISRCLINHVFDRKLIGTQCRPAMIKHIFKRLK
jgi:hypothetical protein